MALFGNKDKFPDYDPTDVSRWLSETEGTKRKVLDKALEFRKARSVKKAGRILKEIKELLETL
jgi:hypothetical protein